MIYYLFKKSRSYNVQIISYAIKLRIFGLFCTRGVSLIVTELSIVTLYPKQAFCGESINSITFLSNKTIATVDPCSLIGTPF